MLWAISSYYNPARYRTRLANFHAFRAELAVPLVVVEASSDGRFELKPGDADVLVQISDAAVLWQKERLLNVALRRLPPECRYVAWVDCDVVFGTGDWADRAVKALRTHNLVQLYSKRQNLGRDGRVAQTAISAAERVATGTAAPAQLWDTQAGIHRGSTTGGLMDSCGFYDACIMGSGDRVMLCTAIGRLDFGVRVVGMSPRQREHYRRWGTRFAGAIEGLVGAVGGEIMHLWHGDMEARGYGTRYAGLRPFEFDPFTDIAVCPGGSWRWSSPKPEMHAYVKAYFDSRREDGD
jgi:hypothetical protein